MCNLVIIQSISFVRNRKITFYVYSKCRGKNMTKTATNIMHLFDTIAFSPKHTIGS